MLSKSCEICGKEFRKKTSHSIKAWEQTKFCSHRCYSLARVGGRGKYSAYWKGKHLPDDVKKRVSETCKRKGVAPSNEAREKAKRFGPANNRWKGGITPEHRKIRNSVEYKLWRKAIFERDGYTCIFCGSNKSGTLNADHIKPFSLFPELRFAIDNGRTLCETCHRKTDTYGTGSWEKNYKP